MSAMTTNAPVPLVGVTCCLIAGVDSSSHRVQDKYVDSVVLGAGAVPVLLPAIRS